MYKLIFYSFLFTYLSLNAQDSIKNKWFDLNLQGALILNKGLSNVYGSELNVQNSPISYTKSNVIRQKPICFGFSIGIEGVMGKSKKIKQLIGLNYDYTNSYFNNYYNFESSNRISGSIYIQDVNIKRTVQFLVGSYGGKCQIKSFSVAILGCYNFILSKQETQNGYIKKSNGTIFPDSIPVINKKISNASDTSFVSLRLRLAYDLKLKNQKISIYIMRNFNIFNGFASEHSYLAPWWYIGLYYKPILARKKK